MTDLTPAAIVRELDKYIVGQTEAKKAVAVALISRERRKKVPGELQHDIVPKNIIMIGPTGVGKTELARRVSRLLDAPFVKVEATKFTEVGYVGRDVDSIIAELVETAFMKVYDVRLREVEGKAAELANEKLVGYVCQQLGPQRQRRAKSAAPVAAARNAKSPERSAPTRRAVAKLLASNKLDDQIVEIELGDEGPSAALQAGYGLDTDEYGESFSDFLEDVRTSRAHSRRRKVSVKEAKRILTRAEAGKLMDLNEIVDEAVRQTEETGVVFIDELDKLAGPKVDLGRDISGEGVQRDLLPLLEGATVMTRFGPVKTDFILYITAGAFYDSKPSDLLAELQGRLPIRVELLPLTQTDLERILTEPQNALTKQYTALMATEGVELEFTTAGIREIARLAALMNDRTENIGARRLNTIMEKVLEDISYDAPEKHGQKVVIDPVYVRQRVLKLIKDEDLSRYLM